MRRSLLLVGLPVLIAGIGVSLVGLFDEPACPSGDDSPVPVLVAEQLIRRGTSGVLIAKRRLYTTSVIPCSSRKSGAIADPEELLGTSLANDVFPGQQLTQSDLSPR